MHRLLVLRPREREHSDASPPPPESFALEEFPALRWAVEHLEPRFVSPETSQVHGRAREYLDGMGIESWLWLPIVHGDRAGSVPASPVEEGQEMPDLAGQQTQRSRSHFMAGRFEDAERCAERVMGLAPRSASARILMMPSSVSSASLTWAHSRR